MNSLIELSPEILSYGAGKTNAPKCYRLAKEAQSNLFRLHRQVLEGDTETGGDCFLADEV